MSLPLPPLPLIVLDTETTGFVPKVHRVIEYASAEYRDGKLVGEYEQLFSTKEIPPVVQVITRIRADHLAGKPSFEEKREEILRKIPADAIVVGQNVNFDIGMLRGEGIDLKDRPFLDTSMLASLVFPELDSYSLGYLSRVLKLNHDPPHRALGDVRATAELLSACWQRFLELPSTAYADIQKVAKCAPPGLKMLLEALPKPTAKQNPIWFAPLTVAGKATSDETLVIDPPKTGVHLQESSLDPGELQRVIEGARKAGKKKRTWIAVKNLRLALERLPADLETRGVRVLYPARLLLDPEARDRFLKQETLTTDEATLALKLRWFPDANRMALALHGGEESIWNGKIGATVDSKVFAQQFNDLPQIVLLEHRDLLEILESETHPGYKALLAKDTHVIIDDASMLEDTATKAYGWYVSLDTLRATAEGDTLLTKFLDTFQLWIEQVRQFQDLRYLAVSDLSSREGTGLRDVLDEVIGSREWTNQGKKMLLDLKKILDPANLPHRIAWIEQNRQGSQYIQSVPEHIGILLQEALFAEVPTTLLIPSGSAGMLPEILPEGGRTEKATAGITHTMPVTFVPDLDLQATFATPPAGKTIVLLSSRSQIDDAFVKHTEALEAKGIALICQGSSGGQGRMQSEFLSAPGTALWLLTPWMFEGVDLPAGTADRLILATLPFDHPSHAVLGRRALSYRDPFNQYSLPRLLHRLYRLLRTFARLRKTTGEVLILDTRLQTKGYGAKILGYLAQFNGAASTAKAEVPVAAKAEAKPKKAPAAKKAPAKKGPQMEMF